MKTKLTVSLEQVLAEKARRLARERGVSVAELFSEFIRNAPEWSPLTASMIGVLGDAKAVDRADYRAYLERKYL